jgi:formamidopyrimidine-DNA glycosylase
VETFVRLLAPRLTGRRIVEAQFFARRVVRGSRRQVAARVAGKTVEAIGRHGKFLVMELDGGLVLTLHLGMTGTLLWEATPGPHTRALLLFPHGRLLFEDPRQFGRIELGSALPERVARLGPDALSVSLEDFAGRLRQRRGIIKPVLLNQRVLRGLGNIYTDEVLFRAGIHPRAIAGRLRPDRVRRLHQAIREVLREAVEAGGSSISDYVDPEGRPGWFQSQHQVYGREGQPCPRCATAIRRIVIAQRGTHYCPRCQRL